MYSLFINNLIIITWNAKSIAKYPFELFQFLNDHNVDVAPSKNLHIPNYKIFRMDRSSNMGGGVNILV